MANIALSGRRIGMVEMDFSVVVVGMVVVVDNMDMDWEVDTVQELDDMDDKVVAMAAATDTALDMAFVVADDTAMVAV